METFVENSFAYFGIFFIDIFMLSFGRIDCLVPRLRVWFDDKHHQLFAVRWLHSGYSFHSVVHDTCCYRPVADGDAESLARCGDTVYDIIMRYEALFSMGTRRRRCIGLVDHKNESIS